MRSSSSRRWGRALAFAAAALVAGAAAGGCGGAAPATAIAQPIFGGQVASGCQWPTALAMGSDCSAVLVDPKVVITAAACIHGTASFTFGEGGQGKTVSGDCTAHPSYTDGSANNIGVCVLTTEVADVPVVPILMGCEAAKLLAAGHAATLVGFGDPMAEGRNFQGAQKRLVDVKINSVDAPNKEVTVGDEIGGACRGDAGGPAYLQVDDGSWRVFGVASRISDSCAEPTVYTSLSHHLAWLETTSNVDLTPCTDADGKWNPGPGCTHFPLNPGEGGGSWDKGCADKTQFSGPSTSCGPNGGGGGGSGGGAGGVKGGGMGGSGGAGGGGGAPPPGTGGMGGDGAGGDGDNGGVPAAGSGGSGGIERPPHTTACSVGAPGAGCTPGVGLLLFGLAGLGLALRRRRCD